ncbi:MAG: rod shape-determining protein [Lachnospiraceae bacterium]|nr:rod shape-determining protein [Candidatus Equihabitans merdae]
MLGSNTFGIDLGTSEVKIYHQKKNTILSEKNMVAVRNKDQLLAVGNDAFQMFEKNPPSIEVGGSVREGALYDMDRVEVLLHLLLEKLEPHIGLNPSLYYSVPAVCTPLEERAYYAISNAGYLKNPKVFLVDRPICDAVALGIPLSKTQGSMIVNVGAQNTDISIIANEMVVFTKSIPIGGQQMNEAICDEVRRRKNLLIGHRTGRRLKAVLASFTIGRDDARRITGVDTLSGLPKDVVVTSSLVNDAVGEKVQLICREIVEFLERTPPQIARSIKEEGIYLTGGTTRIPDIELFFRDAVGCPINLSSYYDRCTIKGLEEIINHKGLYKWTRQIKERL